MPLTQYKIIKKQKISRKFFYKIRDTSCEVLLYRFCIEERAFHCLLEQILTADNFFNIVELTDAECPLELVKLEHTKGK